MQTKVFPFQLPNQCYCVYTLRCQKKFHQLLRGYTGRSFKNAIPQAMHPLNFEEALTEKERSARCTTLLVIC